MAAPMRYKVTRETTRILEELASLAETLQGWLPAASREARREWEEFRLGWPSDLEVRQGLVSLSNDDLAIMESKVRRFHDILAVAATSSVGRRTSEEIEPVLHLIQSGGARRVEIAPPFVAVEAPRK